MSNVQAIQANQIVIAIASKAQKDRITAIGVVDHVEGNFIKLQKSPEDGSRLHWIPLSWVHKVERSVVLLNRTKTEIHRDHRTESPFDYLPVNHAGEC
jgi:hypothetical protein